MECARNTRMGLQTCDAQARWGGGSGVVRAFGAAAETQQAGELHAHFAVWLHGFPQTSLAHPALCPKDAGILEPVEVGLEAFRRPVDGCPAPITARCTKCGSEYRDKDISDSAIGDLATKCGTILTDGYADYLKCRATRIDTPGSLEASLTQSVVIRDVQVRFWTHSRSCFKVSILYHLFYNYKTG
ncbi:hypothetical protein JG688_00010530 [Phytophthora aleatoria]|uniref:Helitron helicase-like domain-containing protein n=1 Tax=Phytophthora aleatoria TaxID=2496075 RepID=A0A8J5IW07_9STRA|nr:hypothetical protein JG688_00010530 [Phytophthora aleatoria]